MRSGIRLALAATLVAARLVLPAAAAAAAPASKPATPAATETAIFAMGCFWCAETAFEGLPGVLSVISGFCGGPEKNPSYEEVSSGTTGHAESVQIVFDPKRVTYAQLLDLFWHNIDPTSGEGQFCDRGHQYRSAIFYRNAEQQKLAEESKHRLETTPQKWTGKIATEIVAATTFWPAEDYHQDFYKKSPMRYESYRLGCGRDAKLEKLWGQPGRQGHD
jgi:peptide-methionine (S)-S-oxide reductase